jgi:FkbM family methyltransferase
LIRRIIQRRKRKIEAELLSVKLGILGASPMVGVDVGSALGLQPHWRAYDGVVEFYLFEPHRESFEALKRAFASHPHADKFHIVPEALSGTGGERVLHMLNCPTGSSLYPINSDSEFASPDDPYIYPVREARIQTRRLSEVLDESGVARVDIVKLDVQGAELEILQGLDEQRRKSLLLVEAEVNIGGGISLNFSPYRGAPTWTQIDELLIAAGMRLLDISVARSYRPHGGDEDWYQREVFGVYANSPSLSAHAWEADVVYVRDWRVLVASGDVAAIRKLALALCGYRFFSEAYFIIEKAEERGVLDAATAATIKSNIVAWHKVRRRFWHRRGALARWLRRVLRATGMSQLLRWKQYMWFDYPNG